MSITLDGTNGITSPGIIGVTDGSNATAGTVGEYITSSVTSFSSITNGTNYNVTTISLTAGDWDVVGSVEFNFSGTTNVTSIAAAISSTSATFGSAGTYFVFGSSNGGFLYGAYNTQLGNIPIQRFNITTTTTIYLIAQSNFTVSTAQARGSIRARRIR
jgi:hypothetical protein